MPIEKYSVADMARYIEFSTGDDPYLKIDAHRQLGEDLDVDKIRVNLDGQLRGILEGAKLWTKWALDQNKSKDPFIKRTQLMGVYRTTSGHNLDVTLAENPIDFSRRRLSLMVRHGGESTVTIFGWEHAIEKDGSIALQFRPGKRRLVTFAQFGHNPNFSCGYGYKPKSEDPNNEDVEIGDENDIDIPQPYGNDTARIAKIQPLKEASRILGVLSTAEMIVAPISPAQPLFPQG